jgi:voltage-gated potassium channel
MRPSRPIRRAIDRFLADPASIRIAAWLMVGATVTTVVVGAVLIRLFDHREFPNIGRAIWFTLQTVTTVGYGDVTPRLVIGRVVASVEMVVGIGFITLVTAAITSIFVEASRERVAKTVQPDAGDTIDRAADLSEVTARLERIEATLAALLEQTRPG